VIVADATGTGVSADDGRQGKRLWTALAGLFVRGVAVDQQRGHVLVSAGTGVYVLDAPSGATLRAIPLNGTPVNGTPGDLAIDERTGRAIVVTYQYDKPASDPWDWLLQPLRRWLPPPRQQSTSATLSSVSVLDTTR